MVSLRPGREEDRRDAAGPVHERPSVSPLTLAAAVRLDPTLTGLQPAARHAAQVGGELTRRRQGGAANAVAVG